jgi:uncharacterized protein (DUF1778 family)
MLDIAFDICTAIFRYVNMFSNIYPKGGIMATGSSNNQRIELRVDSETKQIAERASAALGCSSLTEYITRLIRENSPHIIQQQTEIKLSHQQFDRFVALCEDTTLEPSARLVKAARRLDDEGFQ